MLVWATEFPLAKGVTGADVARITREWLVGSPHSGWTMNNFGEVSEGEVTRSELAGQVVYQAHVRQGSASWYGLQYLWVENAEREWETEVVGRDQDGIVWVSVRVSCTLLIPGLYLPSAKKPHIVKKILRELGGGNDSGLQICDAPIVLKEQDVDIAEAIIKGTLGNRLPVVYVSVGRDDRHAIDTAKLARWVSGMGHVIVEPSKYFSFALTCRVGDTNPYGGAVGIHWPTVGHKQLRLLPSRFESGDALQLELSKAIHKALVNLRPTSECTWSYLMSILSNKRVESLLEKGSTDLNEWTAAFDDERNAKEKEILKLRQEIGRLSSEVLRLEAGKSSSGYGLLAHGRESSYYPGEIQDTIIDALKVRHTSLNSKGRRYHIINDILSVNKEQGASEEIEKDIKRIFKHGGKFGDRHRIELERLGFTVHDDGKHVKLVYRGDDRYCFIAAKTPSDNRTGKNIASDIVRCLFK